MIILHNKGGMCLWRDWSDCIHKKSVQAIPKTFVIIGIRARVIIWISGGEGFLTSATFTVPLRILGFLVLDAFGFSTHFKLKDNGCVKGMLGEHGMIRKNKERESE